jgi:Gamma-glutamyl cyclotransferase, AIG2-like
MAALFSYGTLRQPDVQQALFGRSVPTVEDVLPGFRVDVVVITDPAVIATSGSDRHPILRRGGEGDAVAGARLEVSPAELAAADEYEVDDYVRVSVTLASGAEAWVYVAGEHSGAG